MITARVLPALALSLTLALPTAAGAQSAAEAKPTDSEKLDTLMEMQRQVVRTLKNDPLAGKSYGLEFNFLRVLLLKEQTSISGGLSLFNLHRQAEISLPFFYSRSNTSNISGSLADSLSDLDFTEFTQDIHYRYFLGNTQNGFYLSGFARAAWLSGILGYSEFDNFGSDDGQDVRETETKFGVGVGLGFRKFSYGGLYWGASLNIGRYLLGENDRFRGGFLEYDNDAELIFDVELFKFGWAF